ncbi:hypothetical protein MCOR27_005616 [Pyricularia oryzae]|uniref:MAS3 protein n=4 Tax=Pyricularia TaxID=48558 RepID=A0ABQ8N996_PYRGI|nr:MAS3 protein [Pyricularia oryzae 70-15]ELQ36045.1 MAS3 protein [Pyricularia oryzae Y34]KAH8840684.1 hypothetical protein MCOR01_007381 [Pyricularia oryzae]KAI6293380.1 hypothetical protein MCOR33_009207 [Pyricularia grisea]EHA48719.1 MAS3 protein [Pyricularia oryzae 70-15]KAH9434019.1 hypothetical protein MCOR02_006047 [Pyricularia oryzae]
MLSQTLFFAALAALANAHSVILNAQGEQGSPASVGFKVIPEIARNCVSISPCQQDTPIIREAEIKANIANFCGRTQLNGNIDAGEESENALAAKKVTAVKPGTVISMTIHQVNADGAGPYICDLDEASNVGANLKNLSVTDNVPGANGLSQVRAQQFVMKITMPQDLNCIGGSTGNLCTVRCRNTAQAGPFGGCIAVQQADKKGNVNTPQNIKTASSKKANEAQTKQNNKDLKDANAFLAKQNSAEGKKQLAEVESIAPEKIVKADFPSINTNGGIEENGAGGAAKNNNNNAKNKNNNKNNAKNKNNKNRRSLGRFAKIFNA